MGSGAAAALAEFPNRPSRSRLAQLVALAYSTPSKSPLYRFPDGVVVGAALRTGLLHNLRGAPSQDRNAVITHPTRHIAMLSVFAGHGKHGSCLAELAATVVSRQIRRILARDAASLPGAQKLVTPFDDSLERIVEDAFVEANIAVDATPWSRNSGATATVCLVRKGELVVGTIGEPCVMIATKKSGRTQINMLSDSHRLDVAGEKERVQRFGGVVAGDSVSDEEGRYMLPFTRSLGDLEMRSSGVCQVPAIRTFNLCSKDSHVILSTQRLWTGSSMTAPQALNNIVENIGSNCMVDLSEVLMDAAFGASGPTHDATILCAKLR